MPPGRRISLLSLQVRRANLLFAFLIFIETHVTEIEDAFREMTTRGDISILLITQAVANEIRPQIDAHESLSPAIVEIPSKVCFLVKTKASHSAGPSI